MADKILIVDDMEFLLAALEMLLSHEGYHVYTAYSYSDAMEKMSGTEFNLVITDMGLGDKTGIDVLKEVRKKAPSCPVILHTGAPDVKSETEARRMGAYDYLSKLVEWETLLRSVRMALSHKTVFDSAGTKESGCMDKQAVVLS